MKKLMLLTFGLILSVTNIINAATKSYKYGSREERIAAKRTRTKSDERRQRYEQALAQAKQQMSLLEEKAQAELSTLSARKRARIEQDIATAQQTMAATMARLETMSPAERQAELARMEQEKNKAMKRLATQNPEAYKTFKAMEEMGNALQDVE